MNLSDLAALPPMDVAGRVPRLRAAMDEAGVEALLVTHMTNIRYLSGFTGSAGLLAVTAESLHLVTDGRYADQAPEQLAAAGVEATVGVSSTDQKALVAGALGSVARLGLEAEHVSWAQHDRYAGEWFPDAELVATSGLVEGLRLVKDPGEVARIAAAAAIADEALGRVLPMLGDGPTEAAFGRALDATIRELGASGNSFETIVASGPNAALPHARPTSRSIGAGELVVLDFGAVVDGYCSDMTRTVLVGDPDPATRELWELVVTAQAAGVAAVRAGVEVKEVDRACRDLITDAGHGEHFTHGTGHGVGLDIHEAPRVAASADATLAPGHVVTVEPGVYLVPHGGVRIEDTVVVTDDGCEPLTHFPKTLVVA